MGKFFPCLQRCVKHWTKPATPMLISGLLSDLPRSRNDLLVENALLRQHLIVLTVFAWFFFPIVRDSGDNRFILFSRIHSYAAIGNCFFSISGESRKESQRFQRKRSSSFTSWLERIEYREPSASAVNCSE